MFRRNFSKQSGSIRSISIINSDKVVGRTIIRKLGEQVLILAFEQNDKRSIFQAVKIVEVVNKRKQLELQF